MARQISECPACKGATLQASVLTCTACNLKLEGQFEVSPLLRLNPEEQSFAIQFIKSGGSLKAMAKELGVSYPTVRNRLDSIIERLDASEKYEKRLSQDEIIEKLKKGEISAKDATYYLSKL